MAFWWHQAANHYLSQCWPISYIVTRPPWVDKCVWNPISSSQMAYFKVSVRLPGILGMNLVRSQLESVKAQLNGYLECHDKAVHSVIEVCLHGMYWTSWKEINIYEVLLCLFIFAIYVSCSHFFLPLAFQAKGYCHCYCLSISLSVCPSVCKLYLVRTITHHKFELESSNLHQTCIMGYSQLILKMGVIDLDFQGHFGHFD